MQGRIVSGWWSRGSSRSRKHEKLRLMVTKPPTRSAAHGVRLPVADQINVCVFFCLITNKTLYSSNVFYMNIFGGFIIAEGRSGEGDQQRKRRKRKGKRWRRLWTPNSTNQLTLTLLSSEI